MSADNQRSSPHFFHFISTPPGTAILTLKVTRYDFIRIIFTEKAGTVQLNCAAALVMVVVCGT